MNPKYPNAAAHLQALAETTPDAFITINSHSRIQYANPSIEEIFGYTPEELRGRSLTELMPSHLADRHLEAVDRYLETGERHVDWNHIELPGQHKDGYEVPLQISFSEFTLNGERYFTGVLRDISERKTLEAGRELLYTTRERILETETFYQGLTHSLELIGKSMRWVYGEAWLPTEDVDLIEWKTAWGEDETSLEVFREESSETVFEPGEGLIGRVWETGEYEWIPDVSTVEQSVFERSEAAKAADLKAALAVPVLVDGVVNAVMVFFTPEERSVDKQMAEVTRTVAANLGLVLSRQQAQDSLRQERNLVTNILETTPIGIVVINADGEFVYVNEQAEAILRIEEDENGAYPPYEELAFHILDSEGEPLHESELPYGYILRTGEDVAREIQIEFPNGDLRWLSVNGTPLEQEKDYIASTVFAFQDITAQKRRADQLARLNELGQDLSDTESFQEGCNQAVAAAHDILSHSITTIELYDAETGALEPCARMSRVDELVGEDPLFESERGLPWQAFVENEPRVYSNLEQATDVEATHTPFSSVLILPIGGHGVLISGATEPNSFDESVISLAKILVQNVASAFDRLDRELSLRDQKSELESKNEQLQRLQRVNQEIRDITRSLMDAESSDEIKQFVCDRLAESEPYRFVWFGERDFATDEIVPVAWAGVEEGYLETVTVTADMSETGQGPAGRAIRTHEPQIQNNLQSDPPFEPWRQEAMQRGYRASIAVPVVYNDTVYGLLNLYTNEPEVFSDMEEAVLSELGEMIGFALNSRERYNALVSEESVELEFVIQDSENPLMAFLSEYNGKFSLENIATRHGNDVSAFGTFENVPFETIQDFIAEQPIVDDITLIREQDGETIVEIPLPSGTFIRSLLDRGAVPTTLRGTPGEGRVTIRISKTASVREFVELFENRFGDVELVARREIADPVRTTEEFEQAYLDRLTQRQEEVLRTAFFAGFFEQPRANSARDIADMLDVSQPTVSRHIRSSEESLFSMLFGDVGSR
ncbi:GAF domain-containing protein [Halohasta litorea]|uniref:GAF domain-containing protein n=1 Tax=Halohasta litorea TaxID=869891 RepID=A0ABD6DBD4_9EURY|nr:GAF domain-containing protein [Halohasta litorea]